MQVIAERITDSEGKEAVNITIELKPGAETRIAADAISRTISDIWLAFSREGDERLPIVSFATEGEVVGAES